MDKNSFIRQCKKNRELLGFSYKDVNNVLIDAKENEYRAFEDGKVMLSKENLERIVRVLCIEEFNKFNLDDYIDIDGMDKDEILDLKNIVEKIVGEVDA